MKVLVADDERNIRDSIARYLGLEGVESVCVENGLAAKRLLEEQVFAAGIIDLRMPAMDGLELLRWIREEGPRLPVIMISAYGEVQDAVEAMKLGAQDYVVKPFDPEELVVRLKKIIEAQSLRDRLQLEAREDSAEGPALGDSPVMQEIGRAIEKVAGTPATVLITGESGTGKEVVARLVHARSPRRDAPFVAVNVAGIPDTLLESELFGYERGAFTGADRRKNGLFEVASGGTMFLDEIGEMAPQLQVKLLRVLQERRIQRLGGTQSIPVDARIVAATNRDLERLVETGGFRKDLYYRLNVIHLHIPPLRERLDDLPLLAGELIRKLNHKLGMSIRGVELEALESLRRYSFPGNVRELENLLERAMIFAEGEDLRAADLALGPEAQRQTHRPPNRSAAPTTLAGLERDAVSAALHRWQGNRTRAAEELGISRRTLLNKIKQYGLE
ncbi:MAG: sigma-54-dependent Fis family transcriptional regulator [Spirochaetales bacterium]|nr:sigma-54-dependent Fis family transcriptional regulator [Spirochaetales bacterium]